MQGRPLGPICPSGLMVPGSCGQVASDEAGSSLCYTTVAPSEIQA